MPCAPCCLLCWLLPAACRPRGRNRMPRLIFPTGPTAGRMSAVCIRQCDAGAQRRPLGCTRHCADRPPVHADLTYAELERLGGTRLILGIDAQALRKEMLEQARDGIRRAVRTARIGSPGAVVVRGDTVEFQPREGVDASAVATAFAPLISGPYPTVGADRLERTRGARRQGLRHPDQMFQEQLKSSRQASMEVTTKTIRQIGIATELLCKS